MKVMLMSHLIFMALITAMILVLLLITTSTNFRFILLNITGNQYSQRGKMEILSAGSWTAVWELTTVLGLLIQKIVIII